MRGLRLRSAACVILSASCVVCVAAGAPTSRGGGVSGLVESAVAEVAARTTESLLAVVGEVNPAKVVEPMQWDFDDPIGHDAGELQERDVAVTVLHTADVDADAMDAAVALVANAAELAADKLARSAALQRPGDAGRAEIDWEITVISGSPGDVSAVVDRDAASAASRADFHSALEELGTPEGERHGRVHHLIPFDPALVEVLSPIRTIHQKVPRRAGAQVQVLHERYVSARSIAGLLTTTGVLLLLAACMLLWAARRLDEMDAICEAALARAEEIELRVPEASNPKQLDDILVLEEDSQPLLSDCKRAVLP